jgi:hypothetical protein
MAPLHCDIESKKLFNGEIPSKSFFIMPKVTLL